jgi:hypothetical protein
MRQRARAIAVIVLLALCAGTVTSSGCTTMRAVPVNVGSSPEPLGAIKVGDTVSVRLRDGSEHRFVVGGRSAEALIAKDGSRVAWSDIVEARRRTSSVAKNTFLGVGIGIAAFWLFAYILFLANGIY